tara:strand:+ start:291 stop:473 length:183 start_codon:yes stop_codon:yes gene_type:complete
MTNKSVKVVPLEDIRMLIDQAVQELSDKPMPYWQVMWGGSRVKTREVLEKLYNDLEKKCL